MLVELIRRPRVHDVDRVHVDAGLRSPEAYTTEFQALREMLVRLNRRLDPEPAIAALEGVDLVVEDRRTAAVVAAVIDPAEGLDVTEHVEIAADLVLLPHPRFVTAAVGDVQEALARDVEANAGVEVILVAVLNPILPDLREIKRVESLDP